MNMTSKLDKIYSKPKWRAFISTIMALLVAISLAVLDDWNKEQDYYYLKIIIFFICFFGESLHIWVCKKYEEKSLEEIAELEKLNNAYEAALSGIIQVCQQNSTDVNKAIHRYIKDKKIDSEIWDYKKACDNLCANVYIFAKELAHNDNCEVSYIKLNEQVDGEISMFSYRNSTSMRPSLYQKKRNFKNDSEIPYHDMSLFAQDKIQISAISGSEKINIAFYRTPEQRQRETNKYTQYIGIPVVCDNRKMVGLLQIVCMEKCRLAEDEEILMNIAKKYFVPYANMFLLLHKMEKALRLGIQ